MEEGRVFVSIKQPFNLNVNEIFLYIQSIWRAYLRELGKLTKNFINRWPTLTKSFDYLCISLNKINIILNKTKENKTFQVEFAHEGYFLQNSLL